MVIIVVSILAVFAVSRSSDGQGYLNNIVRNQVIATGRQSQLTALSRASDNVAVNWRISDDAGDWTFQVYSGNNPAVCTLNDACYSLSDRGSEVIRYGDSVADLAANCSALTAVSTTPLVITFDGDGNRTPATNMRICIDSNIDSELCVSPAGYIYDGTCL